MAEDTPDRNPSDDRTHAVLSGGPGRFQPPPHGEFSILGSNRWIPAAGPADHAVVANEVETIWRTIHEFFPDLPREQTQTMQWAGTTLQASQRGTESPLEILPPTIIEHEPLQSVLSAAAGRATLWPILADQTRQAMLARLNATPSMPPPWAQVELGGAKQT